MSSLAPSEPTTAQLDVLRVDIATTIKSWFPRLFYLTVLFALSLIVLIAAGFINEKTMAATVLAASVQVAFGMVMGFVCVYIGLMMTWFGIDAEYTIKGGVGSGDVKAEGTLKSASPGLLFALGGILLIAVSLHKRIEYQENGTNLVGDSLIDPSASRHRTVPEAPTEFRITPRRSVPDAGRALPLESYDNGSPLLDSPPLNRTPYRAATPKPADN